MKSSQFLSTLAAAFFSTLSAMAQAQSAATDLNPFDALPFNDPQSLEQLAALNDSEFLRRLFDTSGGPGVLDRFFPPGAVVFPVSHGFAGTQETCLRTRSVLPCRFYVLDLITLNQEKAQQNRVLSNPFAPVR